MPFIVAFLIGAIAGLRAMTAPAAVSWAARLGWIDLAATPFAFLGTTAATIVLTLLALGELVNDKLPFTPSRLAAGPLIARLVMGGLSGAIVCAAAGQAMLAGAVLGAVGAYAGARLGYYARVSLAPSLGTPPLLAALIEDAIAVGGGLLLLWL
jgi:uncharacterized membrane protein